MERILFDNQLNPTERLLLLCILKFQAERKYITIHQIATQLNISTVTVVRALKRLKEAKILTVINNSSECGGTLPNTYEINFDRIGRE